MTRPATRYARSDGLDIAYRVLGDGPVDLVLVLPWFAEFEHLLSDRALKRMVERLASFARVILFDRRGSGLSGRGNRPPTLEEQVDDVRAVMEAAGGARAALLSAAEGTALAALFAASHPELTDALILYAPIPRSVSAPDYPWAQSAAERSRWVERFVDEWGSGALIAILMPGQKRQERARRWTGRLERLAATPSEARAIMDVTGRTDVRDVLPSIRVPTLVIRRRDANQVDEQHARYVAEHVPGARLVELPAADAPIFSCDLGALNAEVEELLTGVRPSLEPDRVLATVLFTDVVASTRRATELGDQSWRALMESHDARVRAELLRHGGREVKTLGDGFLAVFDGPARAIRCALAAVQGTAALGIEIRAGIHTGECELVGGDVAGIAVNIAARVMAEAAPGEVLVSRTVTDLVAGSQLEFESRGSKPLKGLPGEWELFAASS